MSTSRPSTPSTRWGSLRPRHAGRRLGTGPCGRGYLRPAGHSVALRAAPLRQPTPRRLPPLSAAAPGGPPSHGIA
eukprot:9365997-Lingulodinium_polyedra.AAC.1